MLQVMRNPSLSIPSFVFESYGEEERVNGTHSSPEDHDLTFKVQIMNTSEKPVVLPQGAYVGAAREAVHVSAIDSDFTELEQMLEDFDDREPDLVPPNEEALDVLVSGLDVSSSAKTRFRDLLRKYSGVFALDPNAPDKARVPGHTIDLQPGTKPVHSPPYRYPPHKIIEIMKQVREKEQAGLIQPSASPFAAPVVLAAKHDGTWRFCVNYRDLNKVTVPDKFPLPRIDTILDKLGGNMFFSTMDLASGFYQIEVAEEDRAKTAFITPEGLYEWVRMPMGLTNSPATFQRAMNLVLAGLNWVSCLVYLDDIIVFSKSEDEHLLILEQVFSRLEHFGFSLKLKKCNFFAREAEYLGHVVSAEGRRPHPRNLKAVREMKEPTNVTQIQSFVGLCNYYAPYIPDYVQKVEPLTRLIKTGIVFRWTEEQQEAFDSLKLSLCSSPLLRFPDFDKPFLIQTDACGYGIGAVLTQTFEDGEHPILYLSRSLQEPERKWAARELEALAVVWAVTQLRPYIEGRNFTVQTDHESLKWLMATETPGRLSRWALKLQEFLPYMAIEYRKGETMTTQTSCLVTLWSSSRSFQTRFRWPGFRQCNE